jgi:hypothetical protein
VARSTQPFDVFVTLKYPQFGEDGVPLEERFFMLEGRLRSSIIQNLRELAPAALAQRYGKLDDDIYRELEDCLSHYLALAPSDKRIHLAASFAYADVPIGKVFEIIFPLGRPEAQIRCTAILSGVIGEWRPLVMQGTSKGHRFVGVFEFPNGVPELILNMEEVDAFMQTKSENQVCLCGQQTWRRLVGDIEQIVGPEPPPASFSSK